MEKTNLKLVRIGDCVSYENGDKKFILEPSLGGLGWKDKEAVAQRIVDCVNAMGGIEDPAAFIEYHKNVLKAHEKIQSEYMALGKKTTLKPTQK